MIKKLKNNNIIKNILKTVFAVVFIFLLVVFSNDAANASEMTFDGPSGYIITARITTNDETGVATISIVSIECGPNCTDDDPIAMLAALRGGSGLPSSCPECWAQISPPTCFVCSPDSMCLWGFGLGGPDNSLNVNIILNELVFDVTDGLGLITDGWERFFPDVTSAIGSNNAFNISNFYQKPADWVGHDKGHENLSDFLGNEETPDTLIYRSYNPNRWSWASETLDPEDFPNCWASTGDFTQTRVTTFYTDPFTLSRPIRRTTFWTSHWYGYAEHTAANDAARFMWDTSIRREPIEGNPHFPLQYFTRSQDVLSINQRIIPETYHWARDQNRAIENIARIGEVVNNQTYFNAIWNDLLARINIAENTHPREITIGANIRAAIQEGGLFRINGIETRGEFYMCASRLLIRGFTTEYKVILTGTQTQTRTVTRNHSFGTSAGCEMRSNPSNPNFDCATTASGVARTQTSCNSNSSNCQWNSGSRSSCTWSYDPWPAANSNDITQSTISILSEHPEIVVGPLRGECAMTFTNQFQYRNGPQFSEVAQSREMASHFITESHWTRDNNYEQELHIRTFTTRGNVSTRERRQLLSAACQPLMNSAGGNQLGGSSHNNLFQVRLTDISRRPTSTAGFSTSLSWQSLWPDSGSWSHTNSQSFFTEVRGCQYTPPPTDCTPGTLGCPPCTPGSPDCSWNPSIPNEPNPSGFICTPESGQPNQFLNQNSNRHTNWRFGGQTPTNNQPLTLTTNNWASDSIFAFFRNNQYNEIRVDLWYPVGLEIGNAPVTHQITYPARFTSISFHPDGTPEPDNTIDTFFRIYSPGNSWAGVGGQGGFPLVPNGANQHSHRIDGEVNTFRTRASWASDSDAPHRFNLLWLNEANITSWSPTSVVTSSGSGGIGGGVSGSASGSIGLDLVCPATMNTLQRQTPVIFRRTANPDTQWCGSNHTCRNRFLNEQPYTDGFEFCSSNQAFPRVSCPHGHWAGTRRIQINFVRAVGE